MKVCWEADNGEEAVRLALEKQPDIVILDLSMPKMNGLVALRKIHDANRDIKIIVLTMHEEKEYIFRVLQAGASSYLLKSHQEDDLIEAIRTVYQGGAYLYPKVTKLLLEDYKDKLNTKTEKNVQAHRKGTGSTFLHCQRLHESGNCRRIISFGKND